MLLDQFDSLEQCDPNRGESDLKVEQNESDIEEQVTQIQCIIPNVLPKIKLNDKPHNLK